MILSDASALIAIIAGEDEADALDRDPQRTCSAISLGETMAGLRRSYAFSAPAARGRIRRFTEAAAIECVDIGEAEYERAAEAYEVYGRGRHAAALNMGDCLAYACAKARGARLLFRGEDSGKTESERATP